jgi:hypothetical protein
MAVKFLSFIRDACFWTGETLLFRLSGYQHKFWEIIPDPRDRPLSEKKTVWLGGIFWLFILGLIGLASF